MVTLITGREIMVRKGDCVESVQETLFLYFRPLS